MGRIRQIRRAYQVTHEYDKALPYLLLAAFLLPLAVAITIGLLTDQLLNIGIVGLGLAILLPMIVLIRRAKRATYKRYTGQAGSAEVALQMLPKKWISTPAIAANRHRDVVHRTLGPGGLVLVGEGEPGRVRQLLASEVRKHERVAHGITVTTVVMGNKQGQVPLDKLADHIRKLPKALRPNQVTDLKQRLRALDAVRPHHPRAQGADAHQPATDQRRPAGDARPLRPHSLRWPGHGQPGQRRANQHRLRYPDAAGRGQPGPGPR